MTGLLVTGFEAIGEHVTNPTEALVAGLDGELASVPRDEPVVPGGPDGLFATLPVRAIVEALRAARVPAVLSNTAGTYVCNAVMYALLDHLRQQPSPVPAEFLHFPRSTELAVAEPAAPSMSLATMRGALRVALETVASRRQPSAERPC